MVRENRIWAGNYAKLYLNLFDDLSRVVDDKIYSYKSRKKMIVFLLSKINHELF
ncbi:unnamed protein product [marine sediment metagenome]|uniref:Uncharacterized protein n=1 Tax=marine sediment metagenome TaxID=412755 RepID=X1CDP2_9ZZZZ